MLAKHRQGGAEGSGLGFPHRRYGRKTVLPFWLLALFGGSGVVLAPAATASFTLVVLVDVATPGGTILENTASASTTTSDSSSANNGTTVRTTVSPGPVDLSLVKRASVAQASAGSMVTYTLSVANAGPAPATNVVVTDPLPAGIIFVSATPNQGTCAGTTTVTCPPGALPSGQSATIVLVIYLPEKLGTLTNSASVASANPDGNDGNGSSAVDILVTPRPSIPALSPLGLMLLALMLGLMGAQVWRKAPR